MVRGCILSVIELRENKRDSLWTVSSVLALPIFPVRLQTSIFGAGELNFRVRDGNGWTLTAINTNSGAFPHPQNRTKQLFVCPASACISLEPLRSSPRLISTGQLHTLLHFHLRPIYVIVYDVPYSSRDERSYLRESFTLRCFQRLSRPHLATQLCRWRDNWCTRGASIPVLSY